MRICECVVLTVKFRSIVDFFALNLVENNRIEACLVIHARPVDEYLHAACHRRIVQFLVCRFASKSDSLQVVHITYKQINLKIV